jgi:protein KIBRA
MDFILQEDTAVMSDSLLEFPVDTLDKETNTECVFIPEKGARKRGSGIVIKRSQTFSPSAAVSKNQYICRVSCQCLVQCCEMTASSYKVL